MPKRLHFWIAALTVFGIATGGQAQAGDYSGVSRAYGSCSAYNSRSTSSTRRCVMSEAQPMQFNTPRAIPDLPNIPATSQFLSGTEYPKALTGPAFRQTFSVKAEPAQLIQWYASTMKNYGWTVNHVNRSFVSGTSKSGDTVSIQVDGASTAGCRLAIFYSSVRND